MGKCQTIFNVLGFDFKITTESEKLMDKQVTHIKQFYIPSQHNCQIEIAYLENEDLYKQYSQKIENSERVEKLLTFKDEYHYRICQENKNIFMRHDGKYIALNEAGKITVIGDGKKDTIQYPFRLVREILVRKKEEEGALFYHTTGVTMDEKGILILGSKGAGKTTLLSKLLSTNQNISILSNDRNFISIKENKCVMEYFPIPVVYAMGTVKGDSNLTKYFLERNLTNNVFGLNLEQTGNVMKTEVPLTDIPKIFNKTGMKDISRVDMIIFPKVNSKDPYSCEISIPSEFERRNLLEQNCFTPKDEESLRNQWIYKRNITAEQMYNNREKFIDYAIKNIPMYGLDYGYNVAPEKLYGELNSKFNREVNQESNYKKNNATMYYDINYKPAAKNLMNTNLKLNTSYTNLNYDLEC